MQLGPVGSFDRAKGRSAVRGKIGRIGMRRVELVFLYPGKPLAGAIGDIDLRRLAGAGAGDQQRCPGLVHARAVDPAWLAQPLNLGRAGQIEGVDIGRQHVILGRGEGNLSGLLIHPNQRSDHPRPLGQLLPLAGLEVPQMPKAIAL